MLAIWLLTKDLEALEQDYQESLKTIKKQEDLIETLFSEIDWFFHKSRQ
jgi:hypothetical protein